MIGVRRVLPFSILSCLWLTTSRKCVMRIFDISLFSGLSSMALKRLLKWEIWESNKFKYLALRGGFFCSFRFATTHFKMVPTEPKTVYLRKDSDNLNFNVAIAVDYQPLELNRIIYLRRPLESSLMLLLQRINMKIYTQMEKINKKKKKNLLSFELPEVNALLYLDEKQLPDDTVCSEIFEYNGKLVFKILSDCYSVRCNSPWVNSIGLPKIVKTDMVIHPLKFESENCDLEKSHFTWYKSEKTYDHSRTLLSHIVEWVEVGNGFFYKVTQDNVGHYLKLECIPKNEKESGPMFVETSLLPVECGECNYYYLKTHELTKERTGEDKIRIVSYNVLAHLYTNTKEGKAMFDYCPNFALEKSQRFIGIACELDGYNADLVCLQEVELFNFQNYLMPHLKSSGYLGFICFKIQDREGTAVIFRENKFVVLGTKNCVFTKEITTNPMLTDILNYVKQNDQFFKKFISLPHSLQLVALKSTDRENEVIIVGNVHLYSVPEADLIRLLQVLLSFGLFQSFMEEFKALLEGCNTTLLLCGDFNSTPDALIHELIMSGSISPDHSIWKSEEMKDYEGLLFNLPVKMGSAFGEPKFTNYTRSFKGCLDYIYYQTDRLEVDKKYPLASEKEVSENVGIPSISFPSDHLPLIVDMKWKC